MLGSLVAIGIEKVKQSQGGTVVVKKKKKKKRLKYRSSDVPSGGADDSASEEQGFTTLVEKTRADEETPELMINSNDQGKAE